MLFIFQLWSPCLGVVVFFRGQLTNFRNIYFADYVTAFCVQNGTPQPSEKDINQAFTQQVTYSRTKLKLPTVWTKHCCMNTCLKTCVVDTWKFQFVSALHYDDELIMMEAHNFIYHAYMETKLFCRWCDQHQYCFIIYFKQFFNVSTVFKCNGTTLHEKPPKYMQRASTITGQITNSSGLSHKGIKGMSIFVFLILQFG